MRHSFFLPEFLWFVDWLAGQAININAIVFRQTKGMVNKRVSGLLFIYLKNSDNFAHILLSVMLAADAIIRKRNEKK